MDDARQQLFALLFKFAVHCDAGRKVIDERVFDKV